jgi:hypothetical protein
MAKKKWAGLHITVAWMGHEKAKLVSFFRSGYNVHPRLAQVHKHGLW